MSVPEDLIADVLECIQEEDADEEGNIPISRKRVNALKRILQVYVSTDDDQLEIEAADLESRDRSKFVVSSKSLAARPTLTFNEFMKMETERIKRETPGIDHKQAYHMAAAEWKKRKNQ